jgi:hypothetical protein
MVDIVVITMPLRVNSQNEMPMRLDGEIYGAAW